MPDDASARARPDDAPPNADARTPNALTRRAFFRDAGRFAGGTWLAFALPGLASTALSACQAHEQQAPFAHLTPAQGVLVRAVAARILPTDDTPGAEEMGAVYFVDQALGSFLVGPDRTAWLDGLAAFDRAVRAARGDAFARLPEAEQVAALTEAEGTPFFETTRFLTLAGAFAHPKYGGNRDRQGWALVGFVDRHVWSPPFGYYDRDAHG
jgi:gluconate 2-dehydrogenase gamma chain